MLTKDSFTISSTTRVSVRKEVIEKFLNEAPGTGKGGDCSKYHYTVEALENYEVILKRPVPLNKGFDFTVNINGLYFKKNRRYSNPSHNDIVSVLTQCRNSGCDYSKIKTALTQIYNCLPYNSANIASIKFKDFENNEHPIEIILLAAKWLFIEQDMTYWNWSGRNMLWNKLNEEGLV